MIKKCLPYDCVWGRIENSNDYNRLNISTDNKQIDSILKYNCGLFTIFSTTTNKLRISYSVHFSPEVFHISKKIKSELMLMGKYNDTWVLFNPVEMKLSKDVKSDTLMSIEFDLNGLMMSEFQLCFPSLGVIKSLYIESDNDIIFKKPTDIKYVFLGSSIAQDCYTGSNSNIITSIYRKYGYNCSTMGCSMYNTIKIPDLLSKLVGHKYIIVVMDNFFTTLSDWDKFVNMFPDSNRYIIDNIVDGRNFYTDLKKNRSNFKEVHIPGEGRYDEIHIKCLGSYLYIKHIEEEGVLK